MQSLWRSLAQMTTRGERLTCNISHLSVGYSKHHRFSFISKIAVCISYEPRIVCKFNAIAIQILGVLIKKLYLFLWLLASQMLSTYLLAMSN